MVTKRLLQIFSSSFLQSYATSYATLLSEIYWVQTGPIFVPPLLHLTSLKTDEAQEIWNIFLDCFCCRYSLNYCISPTHPFIIILIWEGIFDGHIKHCDYVLSLVERPFFQFSLPSLALDRSATMPAFWTKNICFKVTQFFLERVFYCPFYWCRGTF